MDKKAVVHIHNGILFIKKNTSESVLMRRMKLEPIIQSEVSQKEKHQYPLVPSNLVSKFILVLLAKKKDVVHIEKEKPKPGTCYHLTGSPGN